MREIKRGGVLHKLKDYTIQQSKSKILKSDGKIPNARDGCCFTQLKLNKSKIDKTNGKIPNEIDR